MRPTEALQFEFTRQTRQRGHGYALPGTVTLRQADHSAVTATVQGTETYEVNIVRRPWEAETEFVVSCTCPAFRDRAEACKHLWATLLVAERAGHLLGNGGPPLSRDSAVLSFALDEADRTVNAAARLPKTPPTRSTASVFLEQVTHDLHIRDAVAPAPYRYRDSTLLYVVDGPESAGKDHVALNVLHQTRTKQGTPGKPKLLRLVPGDIEKAPAADRRLLSLLAGAPIRQPYAYWTSTAERPATFELPGPLAAELLPVIARTARGWYRSGPHASLEPITWDDGNAWRFRLRIESVDGAYRVTGALERDTVAVPISERFQVLAGGLVYVRRTIARLEPGPADPFLKQLQRTGPLMVEGADVPRLAQALGQSGVVLPELPEPLRLETVHVAPLPRLSLRSPPEGLREVVHADLSFDYAGAIIEGPGGAVTRYDPASRRLIHRDMAAEAAAHTRLLDLGFRPGHESVRLQLPWHQFTGVVRELVAAGWYVEAEGVRYRSPAAVELRVSSGIDWFDLDAVVSFGDQQMALTDLLASWRPGVPGVRLGDGSIGLLPEDWIARYAGLTATGELAGTRLRFGRAQATMLDALLEARAADTSIEVDAVFARARAELAAFDRITPLEPASSFRGTLRGYQREGLGWFGFLRQFGFGGCLADDMGLGKTVMVLALLDARRQDRQDALTGGGERRPSLVVVPRSLVGNWLAEAATFTPDLRIRDHSHAARDAGETTFGDADVVLVTYGTLRRDVAALSETRFDYVILDEAQTIKNATTASAKAARLLRADHRLALSGTPVENHLGELWSLFEFLNPGVLGRSTTFRRLTATDETDAATTALVARGLRPFILRRTKRQVARELPEKTEQTITCELLPKDRRLYDSLRQHYRATLLDRIDRQGLAKSRMHVLEALLRLRQVACHAGLVDPTRVQDDSAKFDILVPQLEEVVAEGHKAIVFSQFTSLLALLGQRLAATKLTYEYLDGHTRDRAKRVQRFQEDPAVPIFLVSLKAGGLGLNLTAAEYVFLLDPWWNPAVEAQAIDRAHRIGQTREVFAYRLIAKDTVEEKVLALQQTKRDLADAVLSADAVGLRHLSREDLDLLLT